MHKKYLIDLTETELQQVYEVIDKGKISARKVRRAHILLLASEHETDDMITQEVHVSLPTVQRTRQRFVEGGLLYALNERRRSGQPGKLTGRQVAFLVALACTTPPNGRQRWTMQLLADKLIALHLVETISDETVRQQLKKTPSNPGNGTSGVSLPWEQNSCGIWKTF